MPVFGPCRTVKLESGRVVGVISIGDVVRAVIEDLRFTVRQLESYIRTGG